MLNTELIENLYAGLSKEQQQELLTLLFKRSKQTLSYFKRTKDITLSKLEILADFFHMPLDYFRMGNTFKGNHVSGNNNQVGNVSVNTNLMLENEALRKEIKALQDIVKAKNDALATKDMLIQTLMAKNDLKE